MSETKRKPCKEWESECGRYHIRLYQNADGFYYETDGGVRLIGNVRYRDALFAVGDHVSRMFETGVRFGKCRDHVAARQAAREDRMRDYFKETREKYLAQFKS